jgi:hypothetical protein
MSPLGYSTLRAAHLLCVCNASPHVFGPDSEDGIADLDSNRFTIGRDSVAKTARQCRAVF